MIICCYISLENLKSLPRAKTEIFAQIPRVLFCQEIVLSLPFHGQETQNIGVTQEPEVLLSEVP